MATIVCTALMLMLLIFSDSAMAAALASARCFAQGVMPALAPMMVLGKMLPNRTKPEHSPKTAVLRSTLFAFAAGSPAAAQRLRAGGWRGRGWECMLCLTGVMSPMFFTGTLAGWLGSRRDGWVLLMAHWTGAIVTAGLWQLMFPKENAVHIAPKQDQKVTLPAAIAQSAQSLLCVLGAMMVFSVAASLLRSALALAAPAWTAAHEDILAVAWAVMEIGGGSSAVIGATEHPQALLSALTGFGGLSIWLQNLLFVEDSIRPAKLLAMRALHGAVCYGIVRLLCLF